jgi:hypothetical protein
MINKAKAEFERKFRNKPIGTALILGAKKRKDRFPLHGQLPKQTRFTGSKSYPTAYNGFMLVGQPRQHRHDNLIQSNFFKQMSGLVERFGSLPKLLKYQEEKPISREELFRQKFPEIQPEADWGRGNLDAVSLQPGESLDVDEMSDITPSWVDRETRGAHPPQPDLPYEMGSGRSVSVF